MELVWTLQTNIVLFLYTHLPMKATWRLFLELLKHGADVDIASKNGFNPIHTGAKEGHKEVTRELLNDGAGAYIPDKNGLTSLYVAKQKVHMEVDRDFLNHGASVYVADKDRFTPIYAAAQ